MQFIFFDNNLKNVQLLWLRKGDMQAHVRRTCVPFFTCMDPHSVTEIRYIENKSHVIYFSNLYV